MKIKPKEATSIINSLISGVVPNLGIQHIAVGRSDETKALVNSLNEVKNGHSMVKFWIGDFGSGKSFMLHLLNTVAVKQKFVVANADFTPHNRLYSNDGKSVALYSAIMNNVAIRTKPEGGALPNLMDRWIERVMTETAKENGISFSDVRSEKYSGHIEAKISDTIKDITDVGGFDFGAVVSRYYHAFITEDEVLRRAALKWLKGEYTTKTEARQDLGVRQIINDTNFYNMLKNFCKLFVSIGYSGFMINLDEAVNLYKLSTSAMRLKNYEKIMTIYNDCFQGKVGNLFINIAGTREFLENDRRGLFSYNALKTRLETNKYESLQIKDFAQPVIRLTPLDHNEIFVLLKKLKSIFDLKYETKIDIDNDDIANFMEEIFNKPGASEYLTPREVIRDFLNVLNILRQNPGVDVSHLIEEIEITDERPDERALDAIREI
ncbi:MAG: ATP-binding protein [Pyrinomonadaceae bacterium]|nr:ATP-binding protein [Pyrinomonadaceae bacterium]